MGDLGARLPGALNTGSSSAHCSSVRSVEYDTLQTVPPGLTRAVTATWDTPSKR